MFSFLIFNLLSYYKPDTVAGDRSAEGQAGGAAHREEVFGGPCRCTDHPNNFPRARVTCAGAACPPPPAHPSPGTHGQSARPSSAGAPGEERTGRSLMRSGSRERAVRARAERGGRQTLKLALREQQRGMDAQRWRPLRPRPPGAFPGEPAFPAPSRAPGPGAGPTLQK